MLITELSDAYEWFDLPNVIGMALYADGGKLATKPYVSGGNYINKMSNFCQNCQYQISKKTGDKACPFNYLYWNFMIENKSRLADNFRLRPIYLSLRKFSEERIIEIRESSKKFLSELN